MCFRGSADDYQLFTVCVSPIAPVNLKGKGRNSKFEALAKSRQRYHVVDLTQEALFALHPNVRITLLLAFGTKSSHDSMRSLANKQVWHTKRRRERPTNVVVMVSFGNGEKTTSLWECCCRLLLRWRKSRVSGKKGNAVLFLRHVICASQVLNRWVIWCQWVGYSSKRVRDGKWHFFLFWSNYPSVYTIISMSGKGSKHFSECDVTSLRQ